MITNSLTQAALEQLPHSTIGFSRLNSTSRLVNSCAQLRAASTRLVIIDRTERVSLAQQVRLRSRSRWRSVFVFRNSTRRCPQPEAARLSLRARVHCTLPADECVSKRYAGGHAARQAGSREEIEREREAVTAEHIASRP